MTIHEQLIQWKEKRFNLIPQIFLSELGLWDGLSKLYDEFEQDKANRIIIYITKLYDSQSKRVRESGDRDKIKREVAEEIFADWENIPLIVTNSNSVINDAINYYVMQTQDIRFNAVVSGYDAYANMMKAARRTYSESDMMKTISGSSVPMTPAEIILTVINQGNAFLKGTEVLERTQQIEQQLKKEKDLLSDYVKNETGYDIGNIGNFESKLAAFKIKNKKDN